MIIVTGGAGFIGSNLIRGLNAAGRTDVVVVDDLTVAQKFDNLVGLDVIDYLDKDALLAAVESGRCTGVDAVLHQGACTDTTEPDGRFMVENNYEYSRRLLEWCSQQRVPMIYASSAAVYGVERANVEVPSNERPVNVYGFSKLLFDRHVQSVLPRLSSQVVGLRYFNVYGPGEVHKAGMASVVTRFDDDIGSGRDIRLFDHRTDLQPEPYCRDFVWVGDVVSVVLWFLANPDRSGVFNCGTGVSRTFEEIAAQVMQFRGSGSVSYIPLPPVLRGRYQAWTKADLTALRQVGCDHSFSSIEDAIPGYLARRPSSRDQ